MCRAHVATPFGMERQQVLAGHLFYRKPGLPLFYNKKNIQGTEGRKGNGGCPISLMLLLCWLLIKVALLCGAAFFCGCILIKIAN
jgi:hypothetical protein